MRYQNQPLSNNELMAVCPSAFATQPWHNMSEKYVYIPTSQVIDGMRAAGFQPYSAIQSRTRIAGKQEFTKHVIRFRADRSNLAVGDSYFETILTNSMDGTSCYVLDGGIFRLTCLNGAHVSEATIESFRVRHIGNIIEEVVTSAQRLIEQAPKAMDTVRLWKSIETSKPEQAILAEEVQALRYDDLTTAPNVEQLLQVRRSGDYGNDLWTVFNRLQENATRGGMAPRDAQGNRIWTANGEVVNRFSTGARRVSRVREIKDLSFSSKVNKGMWSLAAKFAELKTGVSA